MTLNTTDIQAEDYANLCVECSHPVEHTNTLCTECSVRNIAKADLIRNSICSTMRVKVEDLSAKASPTGRVLRRGRLPTARFMLVYMLREYTMLSWHSITRFIGKGQHNGAILQYKRACDLMETKKDFATSIEQVRSSLGLLPAKRPYNAKAAIAAAVRSARPTNDPRPKAE